MDPGRDGTRRDPSVPRSRCPAKSHRGERLDGPSPHRGPRPPRTKLRQRCGRRRPMHALGPHLRVSIHAIGRSPGHEPFLRWVDPGSTGLSAEPLSGPPHRRSIERLSPGVHWADCRKGPRHRERALRWASSCAGQKPAWPFSSGAMDIGPGTTRPSGTVGPQKSPPMRAGSESRWPSCWAWITADRWGRRCYGLATTSGPLCRLSGPSRCWRSGPRCCRPSTS